MPRASLSPSTATTPTTLRNSNSAVSASRRAFAPCGLWAASTNTVGVDRTRSRRPGDVTVAKPSRTASMLIGRPGPAPKNASTAASAVAALRAWCGPCSGRWMSSYSPARPRSVRFCPPTARVCDTTPYSAPARATAASHSTARASRTSMASGSCSAMTATLSGGDSRSSAFQRDLMIPAFSPAISVNVSPR